LVVEAPPPLMFAVVYPGEPDVVFCGAVQFAGTVISTTLLAARPPVVAVYVNVSVFAVEPASTVVGLTDAEPDPWCRGVRAGPRAYTFPPLSD